MRPLRVLLLCFLLSEGTIHAEEKVCVKLIVVPTYPTMARAARLQGTVSVELKIGKDGSVVEAKGSGADPYLVKETEKNLRQWKFGRLPESAQFPITHKIDVIYKLEGEPRSYTLPGDIVLHLPDRVEITAGPARIMPQK